MTNYLDGMRLGNYTGDILIPSPIIMSVYDDNAFSERVHYAKRCIESGYTGGRAFDTCFEMCDGAAVMVRLWQIAEEGTPLFRQKLKGYGAHETRDWYERKARHYSPRTLSLIASRMRQGIDLGIYA